MRARKVQVNGIVQGVGFRPFVTRLARSLQLGGWVSNNTQGVTAFVEHEDEQVLDEFCTRLQEEAPAAAHIIKLSWENAVPKNYPDFQIRHSHDTGTRDTLVSPDLATCPDCVAELFDQNDRRYHYPFINCTNCGPRFTIINDLPYDRPVTSMAEFEMCHSCEDEYLDDGDRRYHAQPNACFDCGPRIWWKDARDDVTFDERGTLSEDARHLDREQSDAILVHAADRLEEGAVLAIKGLGGWHLSCDASNASAVAALRSRKHRPTKPLAIMVRDLKAARELAEIGPAEEKLLTGSVRPIVLLRRKPKTHLAHNVAGDLPEIGIMLPSTPVQHLLLRLSNRPLVMTSGNRSGEPIVASDADAFAALKTIADGFLGNNRAIVARYDDSVVRVTTDEKKQTVRRARGYAPMPLMLDGRCAKHGEVPTIFGAGPEQKSTFAFLEGRRFYLSQHLGDLEVAGAWQAWDEARKRYARLFGLSPAILACDMHPEYLASKWARQQAAEKGLPLVEVQHHHAHIASVLGENAVTDRVIGVALDGTGYGDDRSIWGGEIMLATRSDYLRWWHLPCFVLPGGAAAIKNPARTAYALLRSDPGASTPAFALFNTQNPQFTPFLERLEGKELLDQMIDKKLNCPTCSSMGRLFDAVSALLGICEKPGYDGEAACLLEAAARREIANQGLSRKEWLCNGESFDPTVPLTASGFHRMVIGTIIEQCENAREKSGLVKVALSGGCMVNRLMSQGLKEGLRRRGFTVYTNRELPPNDGCISYGQTVIARARFLEE